MPGALRVKLLRVKLRGTLCSESVPSATEAPDCGEVIVTEALLPPPPPPQAAKRREAIANLPPNPIMEPPCLFLKVLDRLEVDAQATGDSAEVRAAILGHEERATAADCP